MRGSADATPLSHYGYSIMTVRIAKQNGVATLTLDRPEKHNAMSDEMWNALDAHLADVAADEKVRAVILTGAGRAFSSGGDVAIMGKADTIASRTRAKSRHRVITALYNLEKPVIAAARGPVYGVGISLALACDLIIASETARFSLAFKNVGLVPDGGAIFFLTQYLGIGRAKELVYTARPLSAHEAHAMGLVMQVVPDERLEAEAAALAGEMAQSATYALALAKKMFQSMAAPTLETLLETEALALGIARLSDDHEEGVRAFREKRPAKFIGR
jgi:2-(1,2-epoxy-1,2-dihydrophenyl)acetyl-CoA isomerase